ncbi:MAG: 6-bladed beta-propeller [Gemmatimonadetes bacterium]|nr:6-bladed beta-propeller [Gemmatimonadota bacterium]MYH53234.1 6-bladed beta-propeller [Gemmatimonadota bacterium]MYK67920.1 6-bladed beta-propeller [Gemmatimonadota bacterium]
MSGAGRVIHQSILSAPERRLRVGRPLGVALGVVLATVGNATAQDRPLTADLEEVYRVGGMNAEEWAFFEDSVPIAFDGAGNLYVLNTQASQVVIVDPQGRLVRAVGRQGEGPGEFNAVSQFWVWPDGRYVVQDMGHGAYQVFSPTGELERFVRMGAGAGPLAMVGGMRLEVQADPAGDALIAQGMPAMFGGVMSSMFEEMGEIFGDVGEVPESGVDERGLERLDLTGDLVSTTPILQVWRVPREEIEADVGVENLLNNPESLVGLGDNVRYYEPGFFWDVLPDGTIAYSDSTAYTIRIARPGGEVVDELRRPFSPEAVTDRIRRASIENALQQFEQERVELMGQGDNAEFAEVLGPMMEGMVDAFRESAEKREFYPEIAVVRGVRATWDGALWIQRRGEEPWDNAGPIDVFNADREYVGTFAAEDIEMPIAFGPDGMVAHWEFDELDVPTLVVRRLPEDVR